MNWNDIKWFNEVVRHGSFSAAARANQTTQATVSRRIQILEQQLGAALFKRGHESSVLTATGHKLASAASEMGAAFDKFQLEFNQLAEGSKSVVITCGALIGLHLSKHIGQLHQGLENTDINLKTTNEFLDLEKGQADLALRNLRPSKGQLIAKRINAQNYGNFSVFGSTKFFSLESFEADSALTQYDWISYAKSMANLPSAAWVKQHIPAQCIKFRMNSSIMILEALRENQALALLPRFIGLSTDGLIELFGPVDDIQFELWAVRRESSRNDHTLNQVIANIESIFARG